MEKVFKPLVEIYNESGRNAKGEIVSVNKDNQDFLSLLKFSMDAYYIYGISEKSFEGFFEKEDFYKKPEEMKEALDNVSEWHNEKFEYFKNKLVPYLKEVQSPSNDVKATLKAFFEDLNDVEKYFYYRCLIKNLNISLGAITINKSLEYNLIELYTPALADSGTEKISKWIMSDGQVYLVDTKINGLRLSIFLPINKEDKEVFIRTRSGIRFKYLESWFNDKMLQSDWGRDLIEKINNERLRLNQDGQYDSDYKYIVLDSELQDSDGSWESSVSIINKDDVSVYADPLDFESSFYLHLFDITTDIPFRPENYGVVTKTLPCIKRREFLETFYKLCQDTSNDVTRIFKLTECVKVENFSEIEGTAKSMIDKGYEGSVVKHPNSPYVCARTKDWIKIKDIQTYDGTIVEILPGESSGKYSNMCGKIKVKANIKGKEITGTCGSGFKDDMRKDLWDNKESYIGKTVEFTILSKTVKDNFQSGIFKSIRTDK
jgi:DNA ligase 1